MNQATAATFPEIGRSQIGRRARRMTPGDAKLRSARVRIVRIVFVTVAALSVLALVGSVSIRLMMPNTIDAENLVQGDSFVIDRPKFTSATDNGGKVVVTAARAIRAVNDAQGELKLEKPRLETSEGAIATADVGTWSEVGQTMQMSGNVQFVGQKGQKAKSQEATWTSANRRMAMSGAMEVQMENGVTTSDQGVWDDVAQTLGLQGAVRMVLASGELATADSANWDGTAKSLALIGAARFAGASGEVATAPNAQWLVDKQQLVLRDGAAIVSPQGQLRGQTAIWNAGGNSMLVNGNASFVAPSGEAASAGQISFNGAAQIMELTQGAKTSFKGGQTRSDSVRYELARGVLSGRGNVQVISAGTIGTGANFVYETKTRRFKISGGARVVMK